MTADQLGPFGRAVEDAIARDNARPRLPLPPLCGIDGCPLPAGHVERAGSPHLPPIVPPFEPTPDGVTPLIPDSIRRAMYDDATRPLVIERLIDADDIADDDPAWQETYDNTPIDRAEVIAGDIAATLERAGTLYATGRRDTPTGTIIGRCDPILEREAWLALRRTGIGSSDVPVLLGLSTGEYAKSELDLYMDKRGETPDDESGEAAMWGNILEDPVAREWARRHGVQVQRVGTIAHVDHRHMLCDLDRRVIGCPDHQRCALEVKTRSAYKAADWREGVPDDTEAQVMHQLAVTGYDAIHVAALIGGQRLESYVVHPDADMIEDLVAIEHAFWHENVLAGEVPAISSLELLVDHLKHFQPAKGAVREVHGAEALRAHDLTMLLDSFKLAEQEATAAKLELQALIGEDATDLVMVTDDGTETPLWTWRSQNKPKQLDKAAVEAILGAPLDSFKVPTGTTRVLRRATAPKPKGPKA